MKYLILCLFLACRSAPVDLQFEGKDSETIRKLLVPTVDEINIATGCTAVYVGAQRPGLRLITVRVDKPLLRQKNPEMDVPPTGIFQEIWGVGGIVLTSFRPPNEKYDCLGNPEGTKCLDFAFAPHILTHEIGHALGLQHEPGTVMAESTEWPPSPPQDAAASLAYLLRKHNLIPCSEE